MTAQHRLTVRNVRPWGGPAVDIDLAGGVVAGVRPADPATTAAPGSLDGGGRLALPGLVNAHAHLDKTWWGRDWIPNVDSGGREGRIAHERAVRDGLGIPDVRCATALLRQFLVHGTTAVRSHVDVDPGVGLRGLEVVQQAAAALEGAVRVETVAFAQDGLLRRPGTVQLLEQAVRAGAAYVGGLDPAAVDGDPVGMLDALFDLAERTGAGIDVHLHGGDELALFEYGVIIDRTVRTGLQGRVTVSHGVALGAIGGARQERLLDQLREAGIGWATAVPNGTPPLPWRAMRAKGIPLGVGTDGVRDLWSPFGDGDMLRMAQDFAKWNWLRTDADLTASVELAVAGGTAFGGTDRLVIEPGAPADLVLLEAQNVPDALTRLPHRRTVIAGGRVVVVDGVPTDSAAASPAFGAQA